MLPVTGWAEVNDFFEREQLTDGLPIVPPTVEGIRAALAYVDRDPADLVATIPPRHGQATVESIAVNAVMAGCLPSYLSVVITAVEAISDSAFNLHGVQTTTHPAGPLVIVNGPLAKELGVNCGAGALGPGYRANATIGRAIRLILMNIGGARPGELDKATLGHPGKYSYCLAENEVQSPWEPLRIELGFQPEDSCVTVVPAEAPHNINDHFGTTAEGILTMVAGVMAQVGANDWYYDGCRPLLILCPEHAATIAGDGFSKADVKRFLCGHARLPLGRWSAENIAGRFRDHWPDRYAAVSEDTEVSLLREPDDLIVIVAGGAGKHSIYVPTNGHFRPVTRLVADRNGTAIRSASRLIHREEIGKRRVSRAGTPGVFDPRGVRAIAKRKALAPALSDLNDRVLGFLDNGKPNARRLLACISDELGQRFKIKARHALRKPEVTAVVPEEQIESVLRHCDAIVTGSGD
ncbi:MAG: hypothetical protein HYX92_08325 [Chloroflexi bacterium]|nr:hypothetical protein [Chloroflexota bacterium]